jgi:polar amino acid transport system permease protein
VSATHAQTPRQGTVWVYTFRFADVFRYQDVLIAGAMRSVGVTALTAMLGLCVGTACALGLIYGPAKLRPFINSYVEFFRNTPFIVQLFFIFFGLASIGFRMTAWTAAIAALTVNFGAYTTEIMRAGILSVPRGQIESAASLGLSPWHTFSSVIVFQAIRNVYASISSYIVLLFLGTSIISQISAQDLFYAASFIESRTFRNFETYLVMSGIYLGVVILFRLVSALGWRFIFARRG